MNTRGAVQVADPNGRPPEMTWQHFVARVKAPSMQHLVVGRTRVRSEGSGRRSRRLRRCPARESFRALKGGYADTRPRPVRWLVSHRWLPCRRSGALHAGEGTGHRVNLSRVDERSCADQVPRRRHRTTAEEDRLGHALKLDRANRLERDALREHAIKAESFAERAKRLPRLEERQLETVGVREALVPIAPGGVDRGRYRLASGVAHLPCGLAKVADKHSDPHALVERSAGLELIDHPLVVGVHDLERGGWNLEDHAPASLSFEVHQHLQVQDVAEQMSGDVIVIEDLDEAQLSGGGSFALLLIVSRGASLVSLDRRVSAHCSVCHRTADRGCMPERPLSSTSVGSVNENSPERSVSSRTSRETRISPPRASAAIRAARTTSFPKKSSSSRMGSPVWSPIRTRSRCPSERG